MLQRMTTLILRLVIPAVLRRVTGLIQMPEETLVTEIISVTIPEATAIQVVTMEIQAETVVLAVATVPGTIIMAIR